MLLDQKDVFEILCCPKTGNKLKRNGDKLVSKYSKEQTEYDIVEGRPILIDFAKSVLNENAEALGSVVHRHSYGPLLGIMKRLVSPPKKATAQNVEQMIAMLLNSNANAKVLIVGGGTVGQGMSTFYKHPRISLVSFDIYASPKVQFLADAHSIPLPDNCFDAVIIQAVLEHVLEPITVVSEIHRILKQDGLVYAETPFLQHVHEGPYDFTRFTESGHRYLFKNFELVRSGVSAGSGTQLLWAIDGFFRGLFRSRKVGKLIKLCLFWLQYFDKLIPEPYNIDAACGVFFLGKKRESTVDGKTIIAHYLGAQT